MACLRWSDVTTTAGEIKDEISLLPDMTKGRHARTVFVSAKLKAELQAYAQQAKCVDRSYPFFASQKSIKAGFNANSLAQTFALLYEGAGLDSYPTASELFANYREWKLARGESAIGMQRWGEYTTKHFESRKSSGTVRYIGTRLSPTSSYFS